MEDLLKLLREHLPTHQRGHAEAFLHFLQVDLGMFGSHSEKEVANLLKEVGIKKVFDWWFSKNPRLKQLLVLPLREELRAECLEMKNLLDTHNDYILKTGLMPESFPKERFLEKCYRRFCDTRQTSSPIPISREGLSADKNYTFLRVEENLNGVVARKPVSYEEASFLPRLTDDDIRFLESVRLKVLVLGKDLLNMASLALENGGSVLKFYCSVLGALTKGLNPDEFLGLLRIEEKFRKFPDSGEDFCFDGVNKLGGEGILNGLFEFVAYVARVLGVGLSPEKRNKLQQFTEINSFKELISLQPFDELGDLLLKEDVVFGENNAFLMEVGSWLFGLPLRKDRGVEGRAFSHITVSKPPVFADSGHKCIFRRKGLLDLVSWELCYKGRCVVISGNFKGFYYIQQMLENPGKIFSRVELDRLKVSVETSSSGVKAAPKDFFEEEEESEGKAVMSLDKKPHSRSKHQILKDTRELEKERDSEGVTLNRKIDIDTAIALNKSALEELRFGNKDYRNIVNKVHEAFKRALLQISEIHPELYAHLSSTIQMKSGGENTYIPESPLKWETANSD